MKPWLIVPAKPFTAAKSRLAAILSPASRAELGARLLERTVQVARATAAFEQIVVVSRDAAALQLAAGLGATALAEVGGELNAAVAQACGVAVAGGATRALILPADLPLLTVEDLDLLCAAADTASTIVVTPSRDGGTNALLLPLPAPIAFAYGADSFRQHVRQAAAQALPVRVVETARLCFDLDSPADLIELSEDVTTPLHDLLAGIAHPQ